MLAFEGRSRRSVAESKGKTGTLRGELVPCVGFRGPAPGQVKGKTEHRRGSWSGCGFAGPLTSEVTSQNRHRRGRVGAVCGFSGARSGLVAFFRPFTDARCRCWSKLRRWIRLSALPRLSFAQDGRIATISGEEKPGIQLQRRSEGQVAPQSAPLTPPLVLARLATNVHGRFRARSLPTRPPRCGVGFQSATSTRSSAVSRSSVNPRRPSGTRDHRAA
jgi:hypothetical protein